MVHFYKFINELYILFNQLLTIFINNHIINLYFLIFPICKIKPEKIKDVIGSGGKVINEIIEKTGVKIDIEQTGEVFISSPEIDGINKAIEIIENITREAEVGEIYLAEVKRIEKFGAFVELFPGVDALVHISKLAAERVNKVEDVVKVGDTLKVKVIRIDEKGRVDATAHF